MKTLSFSLTALTTVVFLSSCSSSIDDRIRENQYAFDSLPVEQKAYVTRGLINTGMTPEAVKIAWGEPDAISSGMLDGQVSQRWLYGSEGGSGWSFGFGVGAGRGHSRTGYGLGTGVSIPINYIPNDVSYVLFKNGLVDSWVGSGKNN